MGDLVWYRQCGQNLVQYDEFGGRTVRFSWQTRDPPAPWPRVASKPQESSPGDSTRIGASEHRAAQKTQTWRYQRKESAQGNPGGFALDNQEKPPVVPAGPPNCDTWPTQCPLFSLPVAPLIKSKKNTLACGLHQRLDATSASDHADPSGSNPPRKAVQFVPCFPANVL